MQSCYKMFYNKEVELWSRGEKKDIGAGVIVNDNPTKKSILKADIQPYSSAEAKKDYGFDIDTTDAMFYDGRTEANIGKDFIKYGDKSYNIKEKIVWETYTELLLEIEK